MNILQPSGYCTYRQGQKLAFVSLAYFICVPYVAFNQQQIFPYTVFTECVSNGGKQRFYYRSQKPAVLVHSKSLVTHSIPFPDMPCH